MSAPQPPRKPPSRWRRIARFRPWVQAAFVPLWLAPIAWLRGVPGCVFHCYGCPLASAACPIGLLATAAGLRMFSVELFPFAVLGVLVVVGAALGSMVCGWACPFGFLQDLAAKVPTPKFRLPAWAGYGRYLVLAALVLAVPYFFGLDHPLFICRVCPAGALEAGVPLWLMGWVPWMSWPKTIVLAGFVLLIFFTFRPWCTVLCPLGGILSLFNRFSLVFLRFDRDRCTECNLCRSRCPMGVKVERTVNTSRCIRCTECLACGAIAPSLAPLWRRSPKITSRDAGDAADGTERRTKETGC